MAWSGKGRGLGRIGTGAEWGHSGLAIVSWLLSSTVPSWPIFTSRGLRISPEDFEAQDFRVNSLLADIPLHDVWAIDLEGPSLPDTEGPGCRIPSVAHPSRSPRPFWVSGMLREAVGFAFGWDDPSG